MVYVGIILLLLIIIFLFWNNKMLGHPVIIFFGIWCISIIFATLKLYDMQSYSDSVFYIIFIGLFGFGVGAFLAYLLGKNRFKFGGYRRKKSNKLVIHWGMAYFIMAMAFVGILILFLASILALKSGKSYSELRNMYYGYGNAELLITTGFINTYINWVSIPSLYALIPLAMISLFEQNKRKGFSIAVFVVTMMYVFASAGRNLIVFMIVQGVILVQYYQFEIPKKLMKHIKKGIVALVILLGVYMILRKSNSNVHVNSIYAYFAAPVYLLDYWINELNFKFSFLHGSAFLYGILTLLNWGSLKMGINMPIYDNVNGYIQMTQDHWVQIFKGRWYNAFVSQFYYFYLDAGVLGVFLGDILFGFLCYRIFNLAIIKRNKMYLPYYLIIVQCIVCSVIRWQLGTATMVLAIFLEWVLTTHKFGILGQR